jgi:hypothetical protein
MMERDPSDDKVTFIPVNFNVQPPMGSEAEVRQFFKWIAEAATAASVDVGYTLYPFYRLSDGEG